MASYLQIENISKSYGPKVLFENIAFNINEGDKIALIAPNGTGKTSLLRILAGKDSSDSGGRILFMKDIRIAFLEQEYAFNPGKTVFDQIMDGSAAWTAHLDPEHLFAYERRVRQILTDFSLGEGDRLMKDLSGGEVKRVALTEMLASEADFFIMDEPTNHLDIDAIEYLENTLRRSRCTLLMVTHDRYFLDRVCNIVMELDRGAVYIYRGDYENYLEKRTERIDRYNAETDRVRNVLRRELEWMHSTPCARTGKAKYRKEAFYELKDRAEDTYKIRSVDMADLSQGETYLGNKVINCRNVSFSWEGKYYLRDFTYNFQRYERVGIVGRNASGKTTFLNLLTGGWEPSLGGELTGEIDRGASLKIGYYHQSGMQFDEDQTVLETVNDTHLLSMFLFPHDMLSNRISRLSGGEKRRLYLLTVLMKQPNLLILDEPTNDLDIVTLNILEEYLKEYKGSLIIVSHDRHFLDRLVDHLFVFCGDGVVKDFVGKYSEYRSYIRDYEAARKAESRSASSQEKPAAVSPRPSKRKLSWKEARELESLEEELSRLESEKTEIEGAMSSGTMAPEELLAASNRYSVLKSLLDEKEMRWLELSEIAGG
ncbi:MAG: ABC-F family ATP-binding cassette domain-containing protein [Bacteroidales bacterium]|nr:ABC-F family ATP-binding cassette domain-containing protein [Bacteroidales bacterium]